MADWNLPLITTNYTQVLADLKARDADALTMLDGVTSTNLPAKAKRWSDANKRFETWDGTAWSALVLGLSGGGTGATTAAGARTAIGAAAASHIHAVADVTGLQTALDGKAPTSHTHTTAQVTGLQTALDSKAAASHTHGISEVAGLQTALDGKAAVSHTHAVADVTGLQAALDGKAAASHTHSIAQVAGLQGALDGKASAASLVTKHAVGQVIAIPHELTIDTVVNGSISAIYINQNRYLYSTGSGAVPFHIGGTWICRGGWRPNQDSSSGFSIMQRIA